MAVLDNFETISRLSRSKIIRSAIDRLAEQLLTVISIKTDGKQKPSLFDTLVGWVDLKTTKKTNFAQKTDEIYLKN